MHGNSNNRNALIIDTKTRLYNDVGNCLKGECILFPALKVK